MVIDVLFFGHLGWQNIQIFGLEILTPLLPINPFKFI